MWYSILLKSSTSLQYLSFIQQSTLFFFFFHTIEFFSIYLSYVEALFLLLFSSFFYFYFYLLQELTLASQRNLSSQKKWQAFMTKEKKQEFGLGLHVRCCSQLSSLTIHEKHLMQTLTFIHALNFLNIMQLPDMGMQAI